ncbi:MAG: urease accessory protein UreF [Dehalococcoidia bacterium]
MLSWFSPAFPTGAFAYSHGLERAVEEGLVTSAPDLEAWVRTVLRAGGGWNDAVLFVVAWRATLDPAPTRLEEIDALARACRGTAELALESEAQGTAFLATVRAGWPAPALEAAASGLSEAVALPVAAGVACATHGVSLDAALRAYLHATAANLVSAGVRLIPLGQTDGQRVLAALEADLLAVAARAAGATLDDLGSAALGVDVASMQHETQYTRLFRS